MPKYGQDEAVLIDKGTGREILPGRMVIGFRGESYRFDYVSKLPEGGSGGKVVASQPCAHKGQDHRTWCESGWYPRELYPSVLGARIDVIGGNS